MKHTTRIALLLVAVAVLEASSLGQQTPHPNDSEFQPTATAEEKSRALDIKRRAEQGDVDAQNDLTILYINGYIFKTNAKASAKWARAAANQGSVKGQVNLGTAYYSGTGVPLDYTQARYWLQKAADQGNPFFSTLLTPRKDGLSPAHRSPLIQLGSPMPDEHSP